MGRKNAVKVLGVLFLLSEPPKYDVFKVHQVFYLFVTWVVLLNSVTYCSL